MTTAYLKNVINESALKGGVLKRSGHDLSIEFQAESKQKLYHCRAVY
jgi:hypothetical protein